MAEKCTNCSSACPTPPHTNPMESGPGTLFRLKVEKNQKIHDFRPKKGGGLFSTFLTSPTPPPPTQKSGLDWIGLVLRSFHPRTQSRCPVTTHRTLPTPPNLQGPQRAPTYAVLTLSRQREPEPAPHILRRGPELVRCRVPEPVPHTFRRGHSRCPTHSAEAQGSVPHSHGRGPRGGAPH